MQATEPDWIRGTIDKHRDWIETALGISLERAIILEVANTLTNLALPQALAGVPLMKMDPDPSAELRQRIEAVEFPPAMPLMVCAHAIRESDKCIAERKTLWTAMWRDAPVSFRFKGLRGAVIALNVPYYERDGTHWADVIVCRQDEVAGVMEILLESNVRQESGVLLLAGSTRQVRKSTWDDLVLDASVLHLVKNDYESFFARESWFRALNLPFRRGYLFHGPPGNGKTSAIRVMLSRPEMSAFTLSFFGQDADDSDLQRMFDRAAGRAPSLVVLEDIDRAFPKNQAAQPRSKISLYQLLNCLDGLATNDGVVVVATANDPTALDPAILRRPGRFDRVVAFPNPNAELRTRYFRKLNANLTDDELRGTVAECEGFSFAQLRESYILAGQSAFEAGSDVGPAELLEAISALRSGMRISAQNGRELGFSNTPQALTLAAAINDATAEAR
jgi:hypothetical protein